MEPRLRQEKKMRRQVQIFETPGCALHFSCLMFEQPRSRNITRKKRRSSHRSLCYRSLVFMGPSAVLLWSGDNKPGRGEDTSVWRLAKWVWLWNIESAKSFKLRQHPAVPLQFNTGSRDRADRGGCGSNLIKHTCTKTCRRTTVLSFTCCTSPSTIRSQRLLFVAGWCYNN